MSDIDNLTGKEIESVSVYDLVKGGYGEYQQFVNDGKFIPGLDGLKSVHRRYMLAVRDVAKSRFQKSAMVLGTAMGKWHPHEAQEDTLYSMVRWGFVKGQGSFGMTSTYKNLQGSAMRYTEVKYDDRLDSLLFKFENYFSMLEGEAGVPEPEFLITPVPIALLRGTIGIGVGGVRTKIPAFTYQSILDAYSKNDPKLLKSAYGLEIDYKKSTLDSLWNIGHGKLVLKFEVISRLNGSVEIRGDASVAKPDLSKLIKWSKEGLIEVNELSTEKLHISFSRVKGVRKITDKMILDEVNAAATIDDMRSIYIIMFSHKGSAVKMGIKGWLDLTMKMYSATFTKWQSTEISKYEKAIERLKLIPPVAKALQEGKNTTDIAKEMNCTRKRIQAIEALPLRMLRKSDFSDSIKKVESKIKEIKSTKTEDLINSGVIVDKLLGSY